MAAQKGSGFLLKVVDPDNASPTEYLAIGGFRTKSMKLNNTFVDATNQDSQQWREGVSGGGIRSMDIAGSGVFIDDTGIEEIRDAVMTPVNIECQVTVPGFGTYHGMFTVTELSLEGPHDQTVTYSIALQSAGPIVHTP
jgi:TP901-1 family phage major tail protein